MKAPALIVVVLLAVLALGAWLLFAPAPAGETADGAPAADEPHAAAPLVAPTSVRSVASPDEGGDEPSQREALGNPGVVAPDDEGRIVGRVLWDGGDPIADVDVSAQRDTSLRAAVYGTTARAGADGRFELSVPAGKWLLATALGMPKGPVNVAPGKAREFDLVFSRGSEVAVVVRDESGAGVAMAELWASADAAIARRVGVTDTRGELRIRLGAERTWLGARKAGYTASAQFMVEAGKEPRRIELHLQRAGARVRGFVRGLDGKPVAGAAVIGMRAGGPGWRVASDGMPARDNVLVTTKTSAQGEFALDGLPGATLRVLASAPGFGVAQAELAVATGGVGEVMLDLPPAVRVTGQVRDNGGRPVGGAQVCFAPEWPSFAMRLGPVLADGSYAVAGVSPGVLRAEVRLRGRVVLAQEVTLDHTPEQTWDVVVPAAVALRGRVVDSLQQPLAGYTVAAFAADHEQGDALAAPLEHATTAADGSFALTNLEARPLQLRVGVAFRARFGTSQLTVLVSNGVVPPQDGLLLTVPDAKLPSAVMRARILRSDGVPVRGARLEVGAGDGDGFAMAESDAQGEVKLDGLLPGSYFVTVRHAEFPTLFVGRRDLAARATLDLADLTLHPGGKIVLTPRAGAGVDLAALAVEALDAQGRVVGSFERVGDSLRSGVLPSGPLDLAISGRGIARGVHRVELREAAELQVELSVDAGLRREVRAELPPGAAAPRWIWYSVHRGEQILGGGQLQRGADGVWSADIWLPAQACVVSLGSDARARGQVAVAPDAPDGAVLTVRLVGR